MNQVVTSNRPSVLCVDDEAEVLEALQRVFKKSGWNVETYDSPIEALNVMESKNYDVIISDMRMPEMNGASFLSESHKLSPGSMKMLLSGYSDDGSTVKAVNDGNICGYIKKPWDNKDLREKVTNAIALKQKITQSEHSLEFEKERSSMLKDSNSALKMQVSEANSRLHETRCRLDLSKEELKLHHLQTVKVFSQLIASKCTFSLEEKSLMSSHSNIICERVGFNETIKHDLENSIALLSLGKLAISEELSARNSASLSGEELAEYQSHPIKAAEMLLPLEHMRGVSEILLNANENYDGSGYPHNKAGIRIPIAARLLRIITGYLSNLREFQGDLASAREKVFENMGTLYDPELAHIYLEVCNSNTMTKSALNEFMVGVDALNTEHIVSRDLMGINGMLLLASNTRISTRIIQALKDYECNRPIKLRIAVINRESE